MSLDDATRQDGHARLIEILVDFRPGAGIRVAPHFYNTESEIDHAVQTMEEITRG